jgi:hypothetical protein
MVVRPDLAVFLSIRTGFNFQELSGHSPRCAFRLSDNTVREPAHLKRQDNEGQAKRYRETRDQPENRERSCSRPGHKQHAERDRDEAGESQPEFALDLLAQSDRGHDLKESGGNRPSPVPRAILWRPYRPWLLHFMLVFIGVGHDDSDGRGTVSNLSQPAAAFEIACCPNGGSSNVIVLAA